MWSLKNHKHAVRITRGQHTSTQSECFVFVLRSVDYWVRPLSESSKQQRENRVKKRAEMNSKNTTNGRHVWCVCAVCKTKRIAKIVRTEVKPPQNRNWGYQNGPLVSCCLEETLRNITQQTGFNESMPWISCVKNCCFSFERRMIFVCGTVVLFVLCRPVTLLHSTYGCFATAKLSISFCHFTSLDYVLRFTVLPICN